jgi:hypothetical protein
VIPIGHEHNGKIQFEVRARKNGNSLAITIPKPLREHNNIQEGDTVAIQAEHSEEYGSYTSFWNQSQQKGDKQ